MALAGIGAVLALAIGDAGCDVDALDIARALDLDHAPTATKVSALGFDKPVADTVPAGESMIVVYEDKDVSVMDVTNPRSPRPGADIVTAGKVVAVDYDEERQIAYLVDTSGVVTILGVRSAKGATVLATATIPDAGGAAKAIARVGERLFVLGASRLHPLRVTFLEDEPQALAVDPPVPLDTAATHLAAGADTLYVAQGGQVRAWTVTADGAPSPAGTFALGGDVRSVLAKGSKLVVLANGAGMRVVDFANAAAPVELQLVSELKDVASAKLFGRTLAVGLDRGSFHTIDLSDFTNPRVLTTNKGALPKFLAIQNGNLVSGTGAQGEVAGIPPVVSATVPALQRAAFPVNAPIPLVFSKPIDPASATPESVKLTCNDQTIAGAIVVSIDRLTVTFRPSSPLPGGASCTIDASALRDSVGLNVGTGSNPPQISFKTSGEAPAPVANTGSSYKHTPDGGFTDWAKGAAQYEWFDVKPAKGMYSYFYADFDGGNLWLLNDWFFAGEKIDPDCYNQFGVWTGGGQERWEIRAYGNKKIEVRKDGVLVDTQSTGIEGGYFFGPSPNVEDAHTMYELKIPAKPGAWGVQLHDPGPTFSCSTRMGDPAPLQGGLGEGGGSASSMSYAQLTAPAPAAAALPENGAKDVPLTQMPRLTWSSSNAPQIFAAYAIELATDAAFTQRIWWRWTYGSSFVLPRGLLVGGTTYYWRVTAWNWLGVVQSPTFSFTTAGSAPPDKPPPATCTDGVKNGNESDVDCGGSCPKKCDVGKACTAAGDCSSSSCDQTAKTCAAPSCTDKVKNGEETDVDCGSVCKNKCRDNQGCATASDCTSNICNPTTKTCTPISCTDGIKNGTEGDIDCGGTCSTKCATGKTCGLASDCSSGVCTTGTCQAPICDDGVKNGNETDVDCGGSCPNKCADTKGCQAAGDCTSGVCNNAAKTCTPAACNDGVKNGEETDVDCGGGTCTAKCADGKACLFPTDCTSGACTNRICGAATSCPAANPTPNCTSNGFDCSCNVDYLGNVYSMDCLNDGTTCVCKKNGDVISKFDSAMCMDATTARARFVTNCQCN